MNEHAITVLPAAAPSGVTKKKFAAPPVKSACLAWYVHVTPVSIYYLRAAFFLIPFNCKAPQWRVSLFISIFYFTLSICLCGSLGAYACVYVWKCVCVCVRVRVCVHL